MLKNKKIVICVVSGILISISSFVAIKVNALQGKTLKNAASLLNKDQSQYSFEYSRKKLLDSTIEERWRNNKDAKERIDIKDTSGNLIGSTIVTDGGSKVIQYAKENGKMVAHSWTLPSRVAAENKRILSTPLFNQVNADISSKKWTDEGDSALANKSVRKFTNSNNSTTTTIYLDNTTGALLRSESKSNNSTGSTEVFSNLNELPESKFQITDVEVKELPPMTNDVVGKG